MSRWSRLTLLMAISLFTPHALSQEGPDQTSSDEEAESVIEEVIVTGSRIRRDEFTSAAPVQIIDGQASREIGLVDTAALLQSSSQATGTQIDNTFNGFVLDNGPGSAQVNLRGLGAARVLLLMNSKRVAPGGVGGAPTSPDLTTIPNIMIDRIELLLDGASSIYGSDAIAGVANVIMRSDFDGFDLAGSLSDPDSGGGGETTLGLSWGTGGGSWSLGVGGEFYERKTLKVSQRPFSDQCDRYVYEDENGRRLSANLGLAPGTTISPCKLSTINRMFIPVGFGNVWYTPGTTNIGIPNFSETTVPLGFARFNETINPVDTDGDGMPDVAIVDPDGNSRTEVDLQTDAYNFNGSQRYLDGDLESGIKRYNLYTYGDFDLGDEANTNLYYEALFSRRETRLFSAGATIFPDVPASNPFNPCNQDAPNGVNCIDFFGFNFGSQEVTPIVAILGDRDSDDVRIDQARLVFGARGDLPLPADSGALRDWTWDAYISHSWSAGENSISGVLDDELTHSLATSVIHPETGQIVCGDDADGDGIPDGAGCVPVNMFHPAIYQPGGGTFGTRAERDYLFGSREFDTEVEQTIVSAIFQGELFELSWNNISVPLVLGIEWREDRIKSIPNDVARNGLLFGFFRDAGATGSRSLLELFMEAEFQLLHDLPFAREWSLNTAFRRTDESTYGSDTTYSIKTLYSPSDFFSLRATYGTSFRAPNAREQFLAGQSGFSTVGDPCVVPLAAREEGLGEDDPTTYDASMDTRSQTILNNCQANGVDPFSLGLVSGAQPSYSVEILRQGGEQVRSTLDPETSTSATFGAVLDTGIGNWVIRAGATYYDIDVQNAISLAGAQFTVNECYEESAPVFCRFITRDSVGLIDEIDSSFFNITSTTARGIDFNLFVQGDIILRDRNFTMTLDLAVTRVLENEFQLEDFVEDDAYTPIVPEYEGTANLLFEYGDFLLRWQVEYISGEQDAVEEFAVSDPCVGLGVTCRPLARTGDYWQNNAAFIWQPREWQFIFGVTNITNENPPILDSDAPEIQLYNIPLGVGYDARGRTPYITVTKTF